MLFTLLGIVTAVKLLQPQNAYLPMEFTPFGIIIVDRLLQSAHLQTALFQLFTC